ncbi:hypothetical protein PARPLA_00630 [Rhodobacteraceae bacterium THAF1]|uniref:DUF5671 domain-containing protein n=1 Tax=Palleronia sp. THAF1 TaxID=2587842 RepID=UPI000F3CE72D|nr:DUF5671 domain-containing protein [Palleronia sp. THAF1]QFU09807.1 hypothetical protein FIU81_14110 [Palleronia sp. THAF1]VDC17290.1 hypothetical protein PARPLA_00630 [Rhodobacteraceae bacterium THAF1]
MAQRGELDRFVRDALVAGRSRDDIRATLVQAGWRAKDADRALGAFADVPSIPPVPRPRPFVSAREAVIYGLAFLSLSVVLVNLVGMLFDAIETFTGTDARWRLDMQAWRVAAILVFAPIFALIDWRADRDSPTRKIMAYAALFFAVLVLLFTLVGVIALALGGGLSLEVVLKALVLAGTAMLVIGYYRRDFISDGDRP